MQVIQRRCFIRLHRNMFFEMLAHSSILAVIQVNTLHRTGCDDKESGIQLGKKLGKQLSEQASFVDNAGNLFRHHGFPYVVLLTDIFQYRIRMYG